MGLNLVLNPGSTSTKIAVFDGLTEVFKEIIRHTAEELQQAGLSPEKQKLFRTGEIEKTLQKYGITIGDLSGVIGIGGLLHPCAAGVYEVNNDMVCDLSDSRYHFHAGNLAALIGREIATKINGKAYIADPLSSDEMQAKAIPSGLPELDRYMVAHTLNERGTAWLEAQKLGKRYEECNFVVCHMGGGITTTAHRKGRMIDGNAPRGEGSFCMDRAGGVNAYALAKLCYSGKYSEEELLGRLFGEGGVAGYLHTSDFRQVEKMIANGDEQAKLIFDAMAYQVSKDIGAMCVALEGRVDAIIITGGIAYSSAFVEEISRQVSFLASVSVYPGEVEMETLARYLYEVQKGLIIPMTYQREK